MTNDEPAVKRQNKNPAIVMAGLNVVFFSVSSVVNKTKEQEPCHEWQG
jgi:hypothetical protein